MRFRRLILLSILLILAVPAPGLAQESLTIDTSPDGRKWSPGVHRTLGEMQQLQLMPDGQNRSDPHEFIMNSFQPGNKDGETAHELALKLANQVKSHTPLTNMRLIRNEPNDCMYEWIEMRLPPQYSIIRTVIGPAGRHFLVYTGRSAVLGMAERAKFVKIIGGAKIEQKPLLGHVEPERKLPDEPDVTGGSSFHKELSAAERGFAPAQYNVGLMYEEGDGVSKDETEAAKWYEKAAVQGFGMAQFNLATMYSQGRGVGKNDEKAASWCQKAAEQGIARAEAWLGVCYGEGRGVPQDPVKAAGWYQKAADHNDLSGLSGFAYALAKGVGIRQDERRAVGLWRKAAAQGHVESQANLASMLARGRGVPQDEAEAAKWYRSAADKGHPVAQSTIGSMYATGSGVAKNESEAVKWFRKAAEQGVPQAQYNLAVMLQNGNGVKKNEPEAKVWFEKARKNGFAP